MLVEEGDDDQAGAELLSLLASALEEEAATCPQAATTAATDPVVQEHEVAAVDASSTAASSSAVIVLPDSVPAVAFLVGGGEGAIVRDMRHCMGLQGAENELPGASCFGAVRVLANCMMAAVAPWRCGVFNAKKTRDVDDEKDIEEDDEALAAAASATRKRKRKLEQENNEDDIGDYWRSVEVRLSLEEEYYLASRGRLQIQCGDGQHEQLAATWRRCCAFDGGGERRFHARCAVYAHYRDAGFVVKCGVQFGGDFLLYKGGKPHTVHALYCAIVVPHGQKVSWKRLKTAARLAQDVRKTLLFCYAPAPQSQQPITVISLRDSFLRPPLACLSKKSKKLAAGLKSDPKKSPA